VRWLYITDFDHQISLGINEGLLIEPAYTLQRANGDRILCPTIARTFTLKFPVRFLLHLRLLQCRQLRFGQNRALSGHVGFQGP